MKEVLSRPAAASGPGAGLLRSHHFQIAYNTNDIDHACALFGERYGIKEFRRLEGPMPAGGRVRMEIGWAGGTMYELLWAEGPGSDVFTAGLPTDRFAIRHHHLGYHVPTTEAWDRVEQEIERGGYTVIHRTNVPGFLRAIIVDVTELGHYLEYILPEAGGVAFFESAPSN